MGVLVTGANGFVGSALCARLLKDGTWVRAAVRSLYSRPDGTAAELIGSFSSETDGISALRNVDQVMHLAARVHVISDKSSDPLAELRRLNVEGIANLAPRAGAADVKRFVFLSSVKVDVEFTEPGNLHRR